VQIIKHVTLVSIAQLSIKKKRRLATGEAQFKRPNINKKKKNRSLSTGQIEKLSNRRRIIPVYHD
jgi:hypothetical protein